MTFAEYMDRALYGTDGYYASGRARSGREGDYFTAPDVGPVFGQILGELFRDWQQTLRFPVFQIIEAGAGEGALAQSLAKAVPEFPYIAIERSPSRQGKLESAGIQVVASLSALAAHPVSGCLLGNELLDAFPVHRVRMKNGWLEEAYVEADALVWKTPGSHDLTAYLERIQIELPEGYETEINLAMAAWFQSASSALEKGIIVLIDYGRPAYEYYAPERDQGTLRAFRNHRVSADFLKDPGRQDLTADVDFTSAALDARAAGLKPLAFMELGSFLMQGAKRFKTAPKGLQYLLHPDALGSAFHVLVLGKNIALTETDFPHNRLKRLGLEDIDAANR